MPKKYFNYNILYGIRIHIKKIIYYKTEKNVIK